MVFLIAKVGENALLWICRQIFCSLEFKSIPIIIGMLKSYVFKIVSQNNSSHYISIFKNLILSLHMQILIFPFAKQRNTKISHYYISIKIYIFLLSWRVQIISAYLFQITLSCPHILPLSHDNFFQVELLLNIRNNFKKWKLIRFISCLSWMCLLSLSVFFYMYAHAIKHN